MSRLASLTTGLILVSATFGYAQTSEAQQDQVTPRFRVQIWGSTFVDFNTRVSAFDELRREVEKGLPPLRTTDNPREIRRAVQARAKKIREARADAKEGDIFTPAISDSFKRALVEDVDRASCAAIMDENPGEFRHKINDTYPERGPLSTVPPDVLAILPSLPDDLQYRFIGRHLVLLDTRSRVILDRIRFAIPCREGSL